MILFNWIVHGGGIIYANTSDYALVCHVYAQSTCGKSATPFATDEVVAKLPQFQSLVEIWGPHFCHMAKKDDFLGNIKIQVVNRRNG
jgi:hypothetical protein